MSFGFAETALREFTMDDPVAISVKLSAATLLEEDSPGFMSRRVSVRAGVYFAPVQGEGVVLNLTDDYYYGLSAESAAIWQALLEAHCVESPRRDTSSLAEPRSPPDIQDSDLIDRQLKAWEEVGLVTTDVDRRDDLPNPRPAGTPATTALDASKVRATAFSWRTALRFIHAVSWTRRSLERRGLPLTLNHLQHMPVRSTEQAGRVEDAIHRVARVYYTLRRLSSQGRDDCLLRSLALVKVLRRVGVNADICFGVQKFPFFAHTWVEVNATLVNERPATVQPYTVLARF